MNYFQEATVQPDIKQFIQDILNAIAQPVMERSVKELLWGYEDEVLYQIQQLDPKMVPTTIVSVFNASVIIYTYILEFFKFSCCTNLISGW
jgi:hypothetical protein